MEREFITYPSSTRKIDYQELDAFYGSIKHEMAISSCSELIDTHNHRKSRDILRIKGHIMLRNVKPFVFISCLN
jgi:hypothetical protein